MIRSLADFEQAIEGRVGVEDRSVELRNANIDDNATVEFMTADRVALRSVTVQGNVVIRSCHIEDLIVDHLTADGLLVSNSRIGRLTVRNTSMGCDTTISDTFAVAVDLHTCGLTQLQRLRTDQGLLVTALRGPLHIANSSVAAMTIKSQMATGRLGHPTVEAAGLNVAEDIIMDDLWLGGLDLHDLSVRNLILRRVRLDKPLRAVELRCRESIRINGLVIPQASGDEAAEASAYSVVADSDVRGAVDVRGLEARSAQDDVLPSKLVIRNTTLARLSVASDSPAVVSLRRSDVTKALVLPTGMSRYELEDDCNLADMDLAGHTFRDSRQVFAFLANVFTSVNAVALESVRNALVKRDRGREVDVLYFITRQREARKLPLLRRHVSRAVLGGILGWGVRVGNPLRALFTGIALTAVALDMSGAQRAVGESALNVRVIGRSLTLASALWLNVGTGTPSGLSTSGWTLAAVLSTSAGLVLSTLIVGIVIRKLVR